jgi:hypothetical protein
MTRACVFVWVAAILVMPGARGEEPPASVHVSSKLRFEADDPVLSLSLDYEGAKPKAIYVSDLPWGKVDSMSLIAVRADGTEEVLRHIPPLDLPVPTPLILQRGHPLNGRVNLATHFPDLSKALEEGPVLVMWSYRLHGEPASSLSFGVVLVQSQAAARHLRKSESEPQPSN